MASLDRANVCLWDIDIKEIKEYLTFTGIVFLSLITRPSSIMDCIRETALSILLSIRSSLDSKRKIYILNSAYIGPSTGKNTTNLEHAIF